MEDQENNNTINDNSIERQHRYRNLLNLIDEINESNDVGSQTVRHVQNILTEASLLNDQCDIKNKVVSPEEILLDSFVISQASDVLLRCTKAVNILSATYDPIEFATCIANEIKTDDTVAQLDILKLINDARDIVPNVIECSFLYGTFDIVNVPAPKVKKVVHQRREEVAKKELIAVKSTQEKAPEDTDEAVLTLLKILQNEYRENGENALKYYDFIIDTTNYCTTIENMFYCSFLIRDGRAKLDVDESSVPYIIPSNKKDLKAFRHNEYTNTQTVISMDMDQWNQLKSNMVHEGYIQKHRKSLPK